jgi:hypothetical protein
MAHEGTVEYFINSVFNYPTLAECYKTAAFDGINQLQNYRPLIADVTIKMKSAVPVSS